MTFVDCNYQMKILNYFTNFYIFVVHNIGYDLLKSTSLFIVIFVSIFFFINFFFIIKYFFQNFKNDFCLLWAVKWLSSSSGNLWNNSNLTILQILLCLKLVTWWYEGMPTIYNKTCFLEYACINVYNCIFQFKLMLELEDLFNISGCELTYMYI